MAETTRLTEVPAQMICVVVMETIPILLTYSSDLSPKTASGSGTDLIHSSVSYTASGNVENLTLTNSGNINATGNIFR